MAQQSMTTIAIVNEKGGCGKTTTAVNLAAGLSLAGYSTCLADLDQQCNATTTFGIDPDELPKQGRFTVADAYVNKRRALDIEIPIVGEGGRARLGGHLSLLPASRGMASLHHHLEATIQANLAGRSASIIAADELREEHRVRLKRSLESLRGHRRFVILDCPGDLGFEATTALIAADWYLIPVFPSGYDLQGLDALTTAISRVRERLNPKLRFLGVLFGRVDARTRLDSDIKRNLEEHLGSEYILETSISSSVRQREAPIHNKTIYEHDPSDNSAKQFVALTQEVLLRVGALEPQVEIVPTPALSVPQPDDSEPRVSGVEVENA